MCTTVILRRPGHDWPLLIAANRDEMQGRPWRPPARHWADRPEVVAGRDDTAGGTWQGINDHGLAAMVMNRPGALGPADGYRSRGEIPLEALDHAEARAAAEALIHLSPSAYRPFNLVVADAREAFWLRMDGTATRVAALPEGLGMITAHDLNDTASSPRIRRFLPLFRGAAPPDPDRDDWTDWERLLARTDFENDPRDAMCIATDDGFGTVSSSLIALPAPDRIGVPPIWRFAAGPPGKTAFDPVDPS